MMKIPSKFWLAPLLIGTSGWAGYAWGNSRKPEKPAEDAREAPITRRERPSETARKPRQDDDPFKAYERLLMGQESRIWIVVSRLPWEQVPEALTRLRELKAVTASKSTDEARLDEIESALYFHWAESDPKAALAHVLAMPGRTDPFEKYKDAALVQSVLAAWMRTDPDAAYEAVKDHKEHGHLGRDMLVQTWTSGNVFENLKRHPANHGDLLGWYCISVAGDDQRRAVMLAALAEQPELKDRDWGYALLFRSWGYSDFNGAIAEAERQEKPWLLKQLLQDNLRDSPGPAMRWAVGKGIPPGGPLWEEGYSNWLATDGAEARSWFSEQRPQWERQGRSAAVAGFLARDFALSEAKKDAANQAAAEDTLVAFVRQWKRTRPTAVRNWLDTAPAAARDLLVGKGVAGE